MIKAKLYAYGTAVLSFIALMLRAMHLKKAKEKAERETAVYKGRAEQARKVQESDADIDQQSDKRLSDARREIDEGKKPSNFGVDRNNW